MPKRSPFRGTPPSQAPPREIAETFIRRIAPSLRVDPSSLRFDRIKSSICGSHVLYQQFRDDLPVTGAWLRIDVARDGRVFNVLNDLIPREVPSLAADEALIGSRGAAARAREAIVARTRRVVERELVQCPIDKTVTPSWKIVIRTTKPAGAWKVYVDARDGSIIETLDLTRSLTGKGRIFDPNPISALKDPTITADSPIPQQAYVDVDLEGLDGSGLLDGEFVTTRGTTDRVTSATNEFVFTRDVRAFREVMAYYHIDRLRRHLGDIGFDDILNHALEVHVDGLKTDGSQYEAVNKTIVFGAGGIPDTEDGEVIVHEYGHAIQDDQVPGFGVGGEALAMGEGFSDFLSASFFADRKSPAMQPMVGTWDAAGNEPTPAAFLRRVDGKKKYPKDIINDRYDDGEIWSACLWQLRQQLGQQTAEKLAIAHHHLLARDARFADAAEAMLKTDEELFGGANAATIRKVFTDRGILKKQ